MAERRSSWPWRKKDKATLLSPFQTTASSFKYIDAHPHSTANGKPESGVYSIVGDARYLEVVRLKEEAEEKARILKEELNAALKEVGAKEAMVKQHEKVAEEAVSGWEKAEKEALSYKEELEAAAKQKSILEDRVVHLNGALKDCMKQVTHVKEEQERKIEETISCKTKEWEGIKAEVDARQVEFERRLMESDAQNCVMTKSLQERARKIMEANDAKERAETEVKVLQVKLGSYEKEISALKYELHVLNKELEIRNEEVECNKKASDAAHKQHLDNVKKLAKLEADCQRLRNLIKKKLPGPAAIAQMRREVEGPQSPCKDMMRRPPIRSNSTVMYTPYQNGSGFSMDFELLKDRMSSMEEETKLLRESLSKKNEELQASRLLCAKTANKLLLAEDQIESLQVTPRDKRVNTFETSTKREPSNACVSEEEEGNMSNMEESSRAESWASALISELALFKKGKAPAKDERREIVQPCSSIEVCTSPKEAADHGREQALTDAMELSENLTKFEDLCSLCKNLDCQLLALQEQVKTLKPDSEDAPKQVDTNIILSSIDEAHDIFSALGMALQRFGNIGKQDTTTSESLTMDPTPVSSFRVLLCKLILLLETLLPLCNSAPKSSPVVESDIQENTNVEAPSQWEQQKQALVTSKERFLEGKSSVMEFLLRLGIILCEACDMEASDLQGMLVAVEDRGAFESTHVNAVGCLEELSLVRDQLGQAIKAKAELESTMASTLQQLEGTKAKLGERDELIMKLQEQVAGLESLGKQLAEQEATKAQLQAKLEAAEVEVGKLQASVATLTLDLADKKKLHEEVEAKCKELGQQLQGRLIYEEECNPMKVPDNDDIRLGKERELVVAKEKLAECQRTILALGKQLSSLSMSPAELSPGGSFDTTSIDSVSLTMDQRSSFTQADTPNGSSREHQQHSQLSNRHGNNHHGDGFSTAKYQNGMTPPLYHHRRGQTPPLGVPPAWAAESKRRVYEDVGVAQEQPLSWSQHHGSFTKGLGVSGLLAETDLHHHHTYHQHHHQRSSSRPVYVSSSCQYSQRHCEAANSQLTWTYPEEEESQLALTVSSPPHTAMSSPARSPARYVQQLGGATRGPGRTAVRTSLAESMNAAAGGGSASSARDLSPVSKSGNKPSPFGKLFSRSNKNHR